MITVMGATGHIGHRVVRLLREQGHDVRGVGRSANRIAATGADPCAGDAADAAFLTDAFRGADAVFTMLPDDAAEPDHRAAQDAKGEAIAAAVRASGVGYVVALSAVGADRPAGTGFIEALHAQEQRLRATGVPLLVLRPTWFQDNAAAALPVVAEHGVVADALAPDIAVPMVATRDVAAAAASALAARDRTGIVELLGPRDLTPVEMAAILGARLGRPDLPYVRLPADEMIGALTGAGFSADAAGLHVAMCEAINDGRVAPMAGRTPENTTPTRFEDLVGELVGQVV
ncbi:NAD(P)H-binding protein [Pseudonocardia sp.]|uniref:NAD(P)H-binding protein n=1 Tax=Pseudonocardia sp. TaxID=60912 RepID=UPI0026316357|nr:NAD(P)H-binding protein [Pseudonocardia sp.]